MEDLDAALSTLVRSSPNAAHLMAAHGFCKTSTIQVLAFKISNPPKKGLFTSPSTFRDASGGYLGDGNNLVSKVCAKEKKTSFFVVQLFAPKTKRE
jgi:hypothetical protein